MAAKRVEIQGMDRLLRKLKTVEELRSAKIGLRAGAKHIKDIIKKYPPSTSANSPNNPTGRWYERGYGPKWRRKDGSIGGRKTSETLGRKWAQEERQGGLQQVIGNNAKYAPWVHAGEETPGGKGPQAAFHGERGWLTDVEVIKREGPKVLKFVKKTVDQGLER